MTISGPMLWPGIERDATWTAGSTASGFLVGNLSTEFIRRPHRSAGLGLHQNTLGFTLDAAEQIAGAALIFPGGILWRPPGGLKARWRLGSSAGTLPAREKLATDGITSAVNFDAATPLGDYRDIDEDVENHNTGGSEDYIQTNTDAQATLICSFPTPSATPATGAGLQCFRWVIEAPAAGAATIVEGALKETGETGIAGDSSPATVAAGETAIVHTYWDADDLVTASGVDAQSRIKITGGAPGTGDVKVHAVDWFSLPTGGDFEGDWQRLLPLGMYADTHQGKDLAEKAFQFTSHLRYLSGGSPGALSADRGEIEIRAHACASDYVEVGRVILGRATWLDTTSRAEELMDPWSETLGEPLGGVPVRILTVPAWVTPETYNAMLAEAALMREPRVIFEASPDLAAASREQRHLPRLCAVEGLGGSPTGALPEVGRHLVNLKLREVVE